MEIYNCNKKFNDEMATVFICNSRLIEENYLIQSISNKLESRSKTTSTYYWEKKLEYLGLPNGHKGFYVKLV